MILTPELLVSVTGCHLQTAIAHAPALDGAMRERSISTLDRCAMFLAQCAYETGRFTRFAEDMDYRRPETLMAVWPSRFPSREFAMQYVGNQTKLATYVYCNRMGNGDMSTGDGAKYMGRGDLMLTGRSMYERCERETGMRCTREPEMLARPAGAARSAAWFWAAHGFNELADAGDYEAITRRLNGGLVGYEDGNETGLDDRVEYLARARRELKGLL